jgi:hypothetical protein
MSLKEFTYSWKKKKDGYQPKIAVIQYNFLSVRHIFLMQIWCIHEGLQFLKTMKVYIKLDKKNCQHYVLKGWKEMSIL